MFARIMIVDDHQLFVDGLIALFAQIPDVSVVAEAQSGEEAMNRIEGSDTTLVLMEMHLPDQPSHQLIYTLKRRYPTVSVIMLTMEQEGCHIRAALDAGASGYVLKNTGQAELLHAIQTVQKGQRFFSDEAAHQMMHAVAEEAACPWKAVRFSRREQQVLQLIVEGHTNEQISRHLNIGVETVRTHRKNLRTKTDTRNVADLVRRAIEQKWVVLRRGSA